MVIIVDNRTNFFFEDILIMPDVIACVETNATCPVCCYLAKILFFKEKVLINDKQPKDQDNKWLVRSCQKA